MDEDLKDTETAEKPSLKAIVTNLTDSAQDLVATYVKLGKATATRKVADVAAGVVSSVVLALIAVLTVVFGFIALAFWIGSLINSIAGGFGIVAGFFALVAVLIIMLNSSVISPMIRNMVVDKVYENYDDDEEENN